MFVDLRNQVRVIKCLVSTDSKAQPFLFDELIVVVRVVKAATGGGRLW